MSYSDFTNLYQLEAQLGLQTKQELFFKQDILQLSPSPLLVQALERAKKLPVYQSEKARSEFLIAPILLEIWTLHQTSMMCFSGVSLDVDKEKSLNGICDFILNRSTNTFLLDAPIFCLVEAKNREIIEGFAQCAAEMYAAQIFNKQRDKHIEKMYGCVTTGIEWQFLRLEDKTVYIDNQRYFLNEIEKILGILDWIVKQN